MRAIIMIEENLGGNADNDNIDVNCGNLVCPCCIIEKIYNDSDITALVFHSSYQSKETYFGILRKKFLQKGFDCNGAHVADCLQASKMRQIYAYIRRFDRFTAPFSRRTVSVSRFVCLRSTYKPSLQHKRFDRSSHKLVATPESSNA